MSLDDSIRVLIIPIVPDGCSEWFEYEVSCNGRRAGIIKEIIGPVQSCVTACRYVEATAKELKCKFGYETGEAGERRATLEKAALRICGFPL